MSGQSPKLHPKKGHVLMRVSSATGIYREFLIEAGWHPDGTDSAVQTIESWISSGEAAAVGHTWGRPPGSETAESTGAQDPPPPAGKPPKTSRARAGRRK